ncbi:MAG TPA: zf-HC2 domain-containing protein [Bacteroidota bacterium]|nr:zf-HC2 domain-containing protein [Bacteroidota bacterium]
MDSHSHTRSLLLRWMEQSLSSQDRLLLEQHLEECAACRQYFESMSQALTPSRTDRTRSIAADPYLPTRIRAMMSEAGKARSTGARLVRWGLTSAAAVLAVLCGAFLGEKLSSGTSALAEQNLLTAYQVTVETGGIADRLQTIAQAATEVSK